MKNLIQKLSSVILIASLVGVPAFALADRGHGNEGDESRGRSGPSDQSARAMPAAIVSSSSRNSDDGRDVEHREREVEHRNVDVEHRDVLERNIQNVQQNVLENALARPADKPRIRTSNDGRVNIRGAMITAIHSSDMTFRITVLGQSFTVNAGDARLRGRNGTPIAFSALAVGHEVRVKGMFSPATPTSVIAAAKIVDRSVECLREEEERLNVGENECVIAVQPVPDVIAPVLRDILAIPAATTSMIRWETNEPATSKVFFGTTTPLDISATTTRSVAETALVRNHSVLLSGLTPNTMFNFIVQSADAAGNATTSGQFSFTTLMLP